MTRLMKFSLCAVVVASCFAFADAAHAQLQQGYQFGIGLNYARGYQNLNRPFIHGNRGFGGGFNRGFDRGFNNDRRFNDRRFDRIGSAFGRESVLQIDEPPFFATFPPVYYDKQIIRRPYGVSPYAAPPGIVPVEMSVTAQPQAQSNPYFEAPAVAPAVEAPPKPADEKKAEDAELKTTWRSNPYFKNRQSVASK